MHEFFGKCHRVNPVSTWCGFYWIFRQCRSDSRQNFFSLFCNGLDGLPKTFFRGLLPPKSVIMPKKTSGKSKNHGKLLPRASVDARDAGHDARAFRPRPRSDQPPPHQPFRLFDVGPCGVRLQASVASAVRPQGAGRRGSGHGAKPARPVRRRAGFAP